MSGSTQSLIDSLKKPVPSNPLRRNEACHQCRKRKLKCDAQRPCSTCLRSHAYQVNHTPKGSTPPPYPDCSYDEAYQPAVYRDEDNTKLEKRIHELESLLRDMTIELEATRSARTSPGHPSDVSMPVQGGNALPPSTNSNNNSSPTNDTTNTVSPQSQASENGGDTQIIGNDLSWLEMMQECVFSNDAFTTIGVTDNLRANGDVYSGYGNDQGPRIDSPHNHVIDPLRNDVDSALDAIFTGTDFCQYSNNIPFTSTDPFAHPAFGQTTYDFQAFGVVRTGWSPHLPNPALTRRLVQAFFAFHIHAGRLFHGPSFLASLDLHPLDSRFPSVAVLHGLCAVGSLYMAEIPPTPVHTNSEFPYVIFHGKWRRVAVRPDSFAEQQAKLALQAVNRFFEAGDGFVPGWQAQILLLWFYLSQARWSEAFMTSGRTLRSTIPLGLTSAPPFKIPPRGTDPGPIIQEPDIMPPADSVIEEEVRRNIFWLAYAVERQQATSNNFALELDDQDICQMLPIRGDQFDLGIQVPVEQRQWCNDKNVLLNHPLQQTDSFILYIKAMLLLSKVKTFNVRYKNRYHSGDPALYSRLGKTSASLERLDPRDTPAFMELDHLTTAFRPSFPPQFRAAVQEETVDPHLYSAIIAAHVSIILLHDPHIDMNNPGCPSGAKVLHSARSILEMMYLISSTSYDVSLLDQLSIAGWYFAGRVLLRFLHAAIRKSAVDQIVTLQAEISYIYSMLGKAGQRVPAAYRYKRILFDVLVQSCGEQFVETTSAGSPSAYIAPAETTYVDPVPMKSTLDKFMVHVRPGAGDRPDIVIPSTDY